MEWDYGAYEGLTTAEIRETTARLDPLGRRRARGRDGRPTSAAGPTGSSSGRGPSTSDTLCVAHGHLLRVLAARWLGLPPVAGRLFLLRTRGGLRPGLGSATGRRMRGVERAGD